MKIVCSFLLVLVSILACAEEMDVARKQYPTRLITQKPAPQEYETLGLPGGVRAVRYQSASLSLKAWISDDGKKDVKRPAVVFLHGGYAFGEDDWEAAEQFVKAGYVLMMPMLRGENGNPGFFEFFGGEVDDAIAAGKYVASLPGVDARRVFLVGHSVGGSLTILSSQMNSPFKAAVALSGYPKLPEWIDHFQRQAPFKTLDPRERAIRDPYRYVSTVKIPLYLMAESENRLYMAENEAFCREVAKVSPCQYETIAGSHQSMIEPSVKKAISFFARIEAASATRGK